MNQRKKWYLWFIIISVLAISTFIIIRGLKNLSKIQEELKEIRQVNQRIKRENRSLYHVILRLRSNNEAIERIIRKDRGMLRSDEIIYQEIEPILLP